MATQIVMGSCCLLTCGLHTIVGNIIRKMVIDYNHDDDLGGIGGDEDDDQHVMIVDEFEHRFDSDDADVHFG